MKDLNLPWDVKRINDAEWDALEHVFPWLILDCWGVVIARFDYEEQARAAVASAQVAR